METLFRVTVSDGEEHRIAAKEPKTFPEVPGSNVTGRPLLAVEVVIVPDGASPIPVRRTDREDIKALERAQEDAALDAEDILTQAAEANALDPVG